MLASPLWLVKVRMNRWELIALSTPVGALEDPGDAVGVEVTVCRGAIRRGGHIAACHTLRAVGRKGVADWLSVNLRSERSKQGLLTGTQ
jgi:hypothetical protein